MSAAAQARVARYVGAAFVAQFVTSLSAGLLSTALLSGTSAEVVAKIGADATRVRVVIVLEALTAVLILALTSTLYVALRVESPSVATWAFALWVAEAVLLLVSQLGVYAALDLVGTGQSGGSGVTTFAVGLHHHAGDLDMLAFSVGALLWYGLMYRSRFVPRWLSGWALVSVALVLVGSLMLVWNHDAGAPIWLYAAYVPVELVVGIWLLLKGSPARPPETVTA